MPFEILSSHPHVLNSWSSVSGAALGGVETLGGGASLEEVGHGMGWGGASL
jgi:hypothetical protein